MTDSGLEQEEYKVSLEHLTVPEIMEKYQEDKDSSLKKFPLTNWGGGHFSIKINYSNNRLYPIE